MPSTSIANVLQSRQLVLQVYHPPILPYIRQPFSSKSAIITARSGRISFSFTANEIRSSHRPRGRMSQVTVSPHTFPQRRLDQQPSQLHREENILQHTKVLCLPARLPQQSAQLVLVIYGSGNCCSRTDRTAASPLPSTARTDLVHQQVQPTSQRQHSMVRCLTLL